MGLTAARAGRVEPIDVAEPVAGPHDVVLRMSACGVCRTDLHVVDGDLPPRALPIVPGHEIVGRVEQVGSAVEAVAVGDRLGVPWLAATCGACAMCRAGRENLCCGARFTGYDVAGGYAERVLADARYCLPLPAGYDDLHAAPLLCAGVIGYRAYSMAGPGTRLGLYGFGAAAHVIAQVARHDGRDVFAFTRPGDLAAQTLARRLGARWAGDSSQAPPDRLDAAILFAPVGPLVPAALLQILPAGVVVCAGIHMSDIPSFPYRLLWQERIVRSVANMTRQDGLEFMAVAARVPIETEVQAYGLADANRALTDLREGRVSGAAVLEPDRATETRRNGG
jgi:propanol-preferring alcohol dehydrogenase